MDRLSKLLLAAAVAAVAGSLLAFAAVAARIPALAAAVTLGLLAAGVAALWWAASNLLRRSPRTHGPP